MNIITRVLPLFIFMWILALEPSNAKQPTLKQVPYTPPLSGSSLEEQLKDCKGNLPCTVLNHQWTVTVDGVFHQDFTGLGTVQISTTVEINGLPLGSVVADITPVSQGIHVAGGVQRTPGNPLGRPALNFPFDTTLPGLLPSNTPLPVMEIKDVVAFSVRLSLMDVPAATGFLSQMQDPYQCKNESYGPLGCSGPVEGLLFFPWFTSDAVSKCCMKHDACFRIGGVGGEESCEDECNKEFYNCVHDAVGFLSEFYTGITLGLMDLANGVFGSSYVEKPKDMCTCDWREILTDATLDILLEFDEDEVLVSELACCDETDPFRFPCERRGCYVLFIDHSKEETLQSRDVPCVKAKKCKKEK